MVKRSSTSPGGPPGPGAAGSRRRRRPEPWAWVAFALLAALVALTLYLGLRPGGVGPILAYSMGRDLLALAALLTGFVGVVWSLVNRPLARRGRLPAFASLLVVIGVTSYDFPYPSSHEGHASKICFRLPFDGEWTVFWGGEGKRENRLAAYFADRRWGLDFVVTRDGTSRSGSDLDLASYHAYGRPVLAPADGEVVRVVDGIPDTQPGMLERTVEPLGNHVVIRVAPEEFLFLAHLKPGSIPVRQGQTVRRGETIGAVGNSGYSAITPEPHLAIHLQDTPEPRRGEAVPWRFCDYLADGRRVDAGLPTGGIGQNGAFQGQRVAPVQE